MAIEAKAFEQDTSKYLFQLLMVVFPLGISSIVPVYYNENGKIPDVVMETKDAGCTAWTKKVYIETKSSKGNRMEKTEKQLQEAVKNETGKMYQPRGFLNVVRGMLWRFYDYNITSDGEISVLAIAKDLSTYPRSGAISFSHTPLPVIETDVSGWSYNQDPGTILTLLRYICITEENYGRWFSEEKEEKMFQQSKTTSILGSSLFKDIDMAGERMEKTVVLTKDFKKKMYITWGC